MPNLAQPPERVWAVRLWDRPTWVLTGNAETLRVWQERGIVTEAVEYASAPDREADADALDERGEEDPDALARAFGVEP
jgi:hypothetical protein